MSLKPLVNDPNFWKSFLTEIDSRIEFVHKQMSQMDEPKDLYRCQGELRTLNSFKRLRDKVNNG